MPTPKLTQEIIDALLAKYPEGRISRVSKLGGGLSGSEVWLVDVKHTYTKQYDGLAFAKFDNYARSLNEKKHHAQAAASCAGPHIPPIVGEVLDPAEAFGMVLYRPAHDGVLSGRSLGDVITENNHPTDQVVDQIQRFLDSVLSCWHDADMLLKNRVTCDSPTALDQMINLGGKDRKTSLESRVAQVGLPGKAYPNLVFPPGRETLPNPLAYMLNPRLWKHDDGSYAMIIGPMTMVHGDLHCGNIFCRLDGENGPLVPQSPWLIDLAQFEESQSPFFDLAYLELDILLRAMRPQTPADWQEWLQMTQFLAQDVLPDGDPGGRLSYVTWNMIKPIRQYLKRLLTEQKAIDKTLHQPFEDAWWLAAAAVGGLVARRRQVDLPAMRGAALLFGARALDRLLRRLKIPTSDQAPYAVPWIDPSEKPPVPVLEPPRLIRIFVSSPSDVSEERAQALEVIRELAADPSFLDNATLEPVTRSHPRTASSAFPTPRQVMLEPVTWDNRRMVPMEAGITPQQAINRSLPKPSQCDIVVILLWSRIGTPVTVDGVRYKSGTHFEFEDAMRTYRENGKPVVLIYWRTEPPDFDPGDPDYEEKQAQRQAVRQFIESFQDITNGELTSGYNTYETLPSFRDTFKNHLKIFIRQILEAPEVPGANSAVFVKDADDIPDKPRRCIGRDDLLRDVEKRLERKEWVLLQGLGGIGKTALAATIAANWIENGRGPVLWLKVGMASSDVLFEALVRPFGAQQAVARKTGDEKPKALRATLRASGIRLLVLDDCWNASALDLILKGLPADLPVLVTSRQRFASMPSILRVDKLPPDEALALLAYHAGEDYEADPQADPQAADLCAMLGDHPFAVEIAGKMLKVHQWKSGELMERFGLTPYELKLPADYSDERRTVKQLLDTSLNILDEDARSVFRAVGAFFAPQITVEMLAMYFDRRARAKSPQEKLATNWSLTPAEVESALDRLLRHGLIDRVTMNDSTVAYYRAHDLVYSYAQYQNQADDHNYAADTCLEYTERYNQPSLPNFRALRPELSNFLGAAQWAMSMGHYDTVDSFVQYLFARGSQLLDYGGFYSQAIMLLKVDAEAARRRSDKLALSRTLDYLGLTYRTLGKYDAARMQYEEGLKLLDEIDPLADQSLRSRMLGDLAVVNHELGRPVKALKLFEQALVYASDDVDQATIFSYMGVTYADRSDYDRAIECYEQALRLIESSDNKRLRGEILGNLGNAQFDRGYYDEALAYYQEGLKIAVMLGDKRREGRHLGNIGNTYFHLGKYEEAIKCLQNAIEIHRQVGNRRREGRRNGQLANVYRDLGRYDEADQCYQTALTIAREVGDRHGELYTLDGQGIYYIRTERVEEAINCHLTALTMAHEIANARGEGNALAGLGYAYLSKGDLQSAQKNLGDALEIAQKIGNRRGQVFALNGLGTVQTKLGLLETAISYYKQALYLAQNNPREQVNALNGIGAIFCKQENDAEASHYLTQSLETARKIQFLQGEAECRESFATIYHRQGNREQARAEIKRALDIYRILRTPQKIAECEARLRA